MKSPSYTSPLRRRVRTGAALAGASARPRMWRDGRFVSAYWWEDVQNFGDGLTPWLLPHYGFVPVRQLLPEARLVGVGSLLQRLDAGYTGAIWGSGAIREDPRPLPAARVLAVRGRLSADVIGARGAVALGDPGILVSRIARRPRVRWAVGVVPHYTHRDSAVGAELTRRGGGAVRVIDVRQSAAAATREIAACAVVLTSSLHGLIVADSYGIPAAWTTLEPPLNGGDFKFRDYESVISPGTTRFLAVDPDTTVEAIRRHSRPADAATVADVSRGLERALGGLEEAVGPLPRFPFQLARVRFGAKAAG